MECELSKGMRGHLQGSAKRRALGLVNFVPADAYHFCLALPAAFSQPGDYSLQIIARDLSVLFLNYSRPV